MCFFGCPADGIVQFNHVFFLGSWRSKTTPEPASMIFDQEEEEEAEEEVAETVRATTDAQEEEEACFFFCFFRLLFA